MRPGCFHPRNDALQKQVDALDVASMRPGCFHPRNLRYPERPLQAPTASMRPGCFHPRNPSSSTMVGMFAGLQ